MDFKLEKAVRLDDKSEHKNLYSWYLQELDRTNKQLSPHYIPWGWSLYFDTEGLAVTRELVIENDRGANLRQLITGRLRPDAKDRRAASRYSFFGTDRTIESFSIRIVRSTEDQDSVEMFGFPAHEYEWDFETREQHDLIEVGIALSAAKFDALAAAVERGGRTTMLRLGGVSGFYSQWSPSIRTQEIKVLANIKDQNVKSDGAGEIIPPVLGRVKDFAIGLVAGDFEEEINEADVVAAPIVPDKAAQNLPMETMDIARLERRISGLQVPLWIAVGLLAVSLFFH